MVVGVYCKESDSLASILGDIIVVLLFLVRFFQVLLEVYNRC